MTLSPPERVVLRRARLRQSIPAVIGIVGVMVLILEEPQWPAVLVGAYWVLSVSLLAIGTLQAAWLGPAIAATTDGIEIGRFTQWGSTFKSPLVIDASEVRAVEADETYSGGSTGRFIQTEPWRWPVVRIDVAADPSAKGRRRRAIPIKVMARSDESAEQFAQQVNELLGLDPHDSLA
jgi:hypothetical protein